MSTRVQIGFSSGDVKDALRQRHPAYEPGFVGVGRWVCIEEWQNVDLLALDCWHPADVIGYEVKVSRSDMRTELLDPSKRAAAVAMCTRFYFAVPAGMLTEEEREWKEPDWMPEDFKRARCHNPQCRARHVRRGFAKKMPKPRGSKLRGTELEGVTVDLGSGVDRGERAGSTYSHTYRVRACCAICKGYGTVGKSRAEEIAPNLWVPRDVGLVAVGSDGYAVLKEAPRRKVAEPILPWPYVAGRSARLDEENSSRVQRQAINQLVRWVSARPDPRHR